MKTVETVSVLLAAALAALVGAAPAALAQPYNQSDSPDPAAAGQSGSGGEMSAPTHPQDQWDRDRDWQGRGPGGGWMAPPWMMGPHAGWMMGPGAGWMRYHYGWRPGWGRAAMPPRGAHFRFKRGDAVIDIRCPAKEDMAACVDAASKLLGEVSRMGQQHPPSSPPKPGANPPAKGPPGDTNGSGSPDREPGHAPAPMHDDRT